MRVCVRSLTLKGSKFTSSNEKASERVPYCSFSSLPPRAGSELFARLLLFLDVVGFRTGAGAHCIEPVVATNWCKGPYGSVIQ